MIKANELRIGNKVKGGTIYSIDPNLIKVKGDTTGEIHNISFESTLQPTPLTPELLENCGFEFINHTFYTKDNIVSFAVFNYDKLSTTYVCVDNEINQVKYLHQLQNLYFALTGKELELNKKP